MRLISVASFSILLLVLSFITISSAAADGYAETQSFRNHNKPLPSHRTSGGSRKDGVEAVLGAEKRVIYTGPNPLHNR
ncbi:hypothetical protein Fmac_030769 [Flemingia macrophylla]|uniref:Uncharacterized protein n=1 Tax=Flemingia macrophylla TaxID=520843 RepID=A0ABD1L0K2_9FABA